MAKALKKMTMMTETDQDRIRRDVYRVFIGLWLAYMVVAGIAFILVWVAPPDGSLTRFIGNNIELFFFFALVLFGFAMREIVAAYFRKKARTDRKRGLVRDRMVD